MQIADLHSDLKHTLIWCLAGILCCGVLMSCGQTGLMKRSEQLWSPEMPGEISNRAPALDLEELEYLIHEATNEIRRTKGLRSLVWSDTIAYVARNHSLDMATAGYFGHVDRDGNSATERAAEAGLSRLQRAGYMVLQGLGENLFATHRYSEYTVHTTNDNRVYDVSWKTVEEIANEAVTAWMDSPGHRMNLLSPTYRREGIGVAIGTNGTLFVTQNLY